MTALRLFTLGLLARRALPGKYGALSYRMGCSIGEAIYLAIPYLVCVAVGFTICAIF